ncbi:MAG: ABC transporter substrate-binding protein [Gammaproteobacteria bacterium]|nr:ABC transporter substrate-binding protein [Gammaproteobacteria bacterium]
MVNWIKKSILVSLLILTQNLYAAPLKLLLDWHINPDHAPILVAISDGYFQKKGLDVELIEPSDVGDPPKLVAMGKADIAITYQPHYLQQLKHNLPIQQIGTLIPTPLDCLIYLPASDIHSPKDLKGKRVGYNDSANEFPLLKAVLKSGGLTIHDITLINVHYSLTQALMMGKIDVAAGMMRNVEPVILQQHNFWPKMFYPEDFGSPSYSELIYVAHTGNMTPEIPDFLDALQEATQYLTKHPEEAWKKVVNTYPQLNTPTNHAIWTKTAPLFSLDPHTIQKARS